MAPVQTLVNFPIRKTRSRNKTLVTGTKDEINENVGQRLAKSCRKSQTKVEIDENVGRRLTKSCTKSRWKGNCENSDHKNFYLSPKKDAEACNVSRLETPKRKVLGWDSIEIISPVKKGKPSPEHIAPVAPRKTFTPVQLFKQDVSVYQQAKLALHTSTPSQLIGREGEFRTLNSFLSRHLKGNTPGCLYLSGAPGTGKTACLAHLLENIKLQSSVTPIFINCMTVRLSSSIYEKIADELGCNKNCKNQRELLCNIEKKLAEDGPMIVLVLDEMDHLNSKNQDVLYTVFEWPRLPHSRLILIGIANALDLTDRVLPRLHACGCRPELLHFTPYSREQIVAILLDRLSELKQKDVSLIKPAAIQLCARKIAACTGDIRKALDTCRRALEVVEREVKSQTILKPTSDDGCNLGSPRKSPKKSNLAPKQVDVPQIMSILHDIYGSRIISSGTSRSSEFDTTLPIQQKLLLCTLVLLTRSGKTREVPLGKLHEKYSRICNKHQIGQVDPSEFLCLCSLIESRGLLQMKRNKEARLSKVHLKIDEEEMQFVVKDKALLASVLNDNLHV